jgi:hypothetical protein
MPRLLSGGAQRLLSLALLAALLLPLLAVSPAGAQDGTGGPGVASDFYDPPRCSPADTNGLVIYQSLNAERTTPNRALIVADQAGERERVVPLDGVPVRIFATPYPNHAVAITSDDTGNASDIEVIDAARGFRYPLEIPDANLGSLIYPSPATAQSAGTRFIVLSDAQQRVAYLVDLAEGMATDLMAIAQERAGDEPVSLLSAMVSPDDQRVLLVTTQSVLLIPTGNPDGDRLVGTTAELSGFHFLPTEGNPLLFTRTLPDGQREVVLYNTEQFSGRQIALEPDLASATPLPNGEAVILATGDSLVLLELTYLARSQVADVEGEIGAVLMAPGGTRLTYELRTAEGSAWRFVNLRTQTTTELPEITGLTPVSSDASLRWIVFAPNVVVAANQGGAVYYSLDLERGITLPTLVTRDGLSYLPPIVLPGEGRYALVPSTSTSRQQYDLIDNRVGLTASLLDGRSVSATLSPDGCWAAVARVEGDRAERNFRIYLVPLDDQASFIAGEAGIAPIWLAGA